MIDQHLKTLEPAIEEFQAAYIEFLTQIVLHKEKLGDEYLPARLSLPAAVVRDMMQEVGTPNKYVYSVFSLIAEGLIEQRAKKILKDNSDLNSVMESILADIKRK